MTLDMSVEGKGGCGEWSGQPMTDVDMLTITASVLFSKWRA